MRRDRPRIVRRVLLGVLLAVAVAVAWNLRRPGVTPSARPGEGGGGQGTTLGDVSFLRFREGSRKVEVKARTWTSRENSAMLLQGVEATFPFVQQGGTEKATITADECLYEPQAQNASFRGHVHVATTDGFELDTERLDYVDSERLARSDDEVRFRRRTASGSGRGLEYRSGQSLVLREDVKLRFESETGPPTEIEAATGSVSEAEGVASLEGGVLVRQGARELRSERLQLNLSPGLDSIERAAAIEDVSLRTAGAATVPGAPPAGAGERHLTCRRLNVVFRTRGVLQEAIAVNGASLEILPGPGEPRERRLIRAPQLRFDFDEEGRLSTVQGLPARQTDPDAPRVAVLTAEPLAGGGGLREVRSDTFRASLDPAQGVVSGADFNGAVTFSEPGRKAWAEHARLDEPSGVLALAGRPRIVDEVQGTELKAVHIEVGTRSSTVRASEAVRHTLNQGAGRKAGMLGGERPAVLFCREFDYDPAKKTARYRQNAVLQSGKDEVRAPTIVLEEAAPGRRRLTASGGVTSTLHPRPGKDQSKEPAAVEARSREMVYEEAAARIVYTGDVEIRQGDILTLSPEAVVTLGPDGATVDHLMAGEPVEVRQGTRRATGERGTYTPSNETLVLVGEKVVLQDADRRVVGRILTFQVGDDRIRVDGREEVRTEAVFKRREPGKP